MIPRTKTLALALLAALLLPGCVQVVAYRTNPTLEARAGQIKSLVLLPPSVEVFELDAGGVKEKRDEWSSQAKKNITAAVQAELKERTALVPTSLSEESVQQELKTDFEETLGIFDAVSTAIMLHTYSPPPLRFEEKVKNFDYSLGEEIQRLKTGKEDAFLLIKGVDHIWTEGRKALQVFGVILGVGAGVATGIVSIPVLGGGTFMSLALVDARSGSILWYKPLARGGGYDFRDPASVNSLVKELFKDFPLGKEK